MMSKILELRKFKVVFRTILLVEKLLSSFRTLFFVIFVNFAMMEMAVGVKLKFSRNT